MKRSAAVDRGREALALLALAATTALAPGCTRRGLEPAALAAEPAAARTTADGGPDYLDPDLRRQVDALVASLPGAPTTAASCGERARLFWRWSNAWSLTGRPLAPDASGILAGVAGSEARGAPCGKRVLAELDHQIRELAWRDRDPAAIGTLALSSAGPFAAASFVTVEQTYTVGTQAIPVGGAFLLGNQIMADQGSIQNADPAGDAYVSARASRQGVAFAREVLPLSGRHGGFKDAKDMPVFRVRGGTLEPGDTVTFVYGDRSGGSRGLQLQSLSSDNLLLPIYIDFEGSGRFAAAEWPVLHVTGATDVAAVAAIAPSVVATGEAFELAVRVEDRFGNRTTGAVPALRVALEAGAEVATLAAGGDAVQLVEGLRLERPGTYRFTVRTADGALRAVSNPVWVETAPSRRVLWGELHGHAGFAEGQGGADQFYRYAREDARLDFVSLTDHDTNLDDGEWRTIRDATVRWGGDQMVTFLGYEWSTGREQGGHHNVFFREPDAARVPRQEAPLLSDLYPRLVREVGADNALVIPHAHNAGDWTTSDGAVERLVEIASMHGTFPWFGELYVENGFEVGFVAASDDHRSKPGRAPGMFFSPQVQPGGLAAALAEEKTPDAIFDALRGRSTYATTGERILVDASLNGHEMGTRQPSNPRRTLTARVSGTAPIDRIDVVKNGELAWSRSYLSAPLRSHCWLQVAFESSSEVFPPPRDNPREYRVWSGSLEVEGARLLGIRTTGLKNAYIEWARIDPERPNRVELYTETRGKAESILLELDGASADTRISFDLVAAKESGFGQGVRPLADIPAVGVTFALSELEASRLGRELPVDRHVDRLTLQVVDVEAARDREFELTDMEAARDGDYYYLRVTQLDGSQAFTSPFWVGSGPPPPSAASAPSPRVGRGGEAARPALGQGS